MSVVLRKRTMVRRPLHIRDGVGREAPSRELDYEGVYFDKLSPSEYRDDREVDIVTEAAAIARAKRAYDKERAEHAQKLSAIAQEKAAAAEKAALEAAEAAERAKAEVSKLAKANPA